jgi:hypothetical protein
MYFCSEKVAYFLKIDLTKLQDPEYQIQTFHIFQSTNNKWQANNHKCGVACIGMMIVPTFVKMHPMLNKSLRVTDTWI